MTVLYVRDTVAARRRAPLYLVDATDGITPETGEAAGQPQISKNGAAWANTTATLTAVGNGKYYVELTAAELSDLGTISVRYKSAATAEFSRDYWVEATRYQHHNYSQQLVNGTERIHFTLLDSARLRVTGQAASITGQISITGGTPAAVAGTFTEISAVNHPGEYYYTLHATEVPGGGSRGMVTLYLTSATFLFEPCTVGVQVAIPTSVALNGTLTGEQAGPTSITLNETTAAQRRVYMTLVDSETTDRMTGKTAGSFTNIKVSKAGGAAVAAVGTFVEIDAVDAPGEYYYEAAAAEVDTEGVLTIYFDPSDGMDFTLSPQVVITDVTHWNGTAVTPPNTAGTPVVDIGRYKGTVPANIVGDKIPVALLRWLTDDAAGTPAALSAAGKYVQGLLARWATDDAAGTVVTPAIAGIPKVDTARWNSASLLTVKRDLGIARAATAQAGSTATTIVLDASASAVDDLFKYLTVEITAGTGDLQGARKITAYNGTTKVATVTPAWVITPDATSTFAVRLWSDGQVHDLEARLTAARAGYLDNLNVGGNIVDVMWEEDLKTHAIFSTATAAANALLAAGPVINTFPGLNSITSSTVGLVDPGLSNETDGHVGDLIILYGGAASNLGPALQVVRVTAWNFSTNIATVTPNIRAEIVALGAGAVGYQLVAADSRAESAVIADAVWDEARAGHTTAGTFGERLETHLTTARAGYLDNLNVGGLVASSAEATAIQNNTRVVRVVPDAIQVPDSGTRTYRIELLLYDAVGNMEAPDSAPTIALVNQTGTDRSARLDSATMALISTGRYRAIYTSTAGDTVEQLVWAFSVVEGGATRLYGNQSSVEDGGATMDVNVVQISGDSVAADNLEALLDGTGYVHATAPATQSALTTAQADITRLLGLMHENSLDDNHVYDASNNLTACRKRAFASKTAVDAAVLGAADGANGEVARYTLSFGYTANKLSSFKWVRNL